MMLSSYRQDSFADPEGYVAQVAVILEPYRDEIIDYVTSPHTGLQRKLKWPPTIAEIVAACDEHAAHLDRVREAKKLSPQISWQRPKMPDMQNFEALIAKHGPAISQFDSRARGKS